MVNYFSWLFSITTLTTCIAQKLPEEVLRTMDTITLPLENYDAEVQPLSDPSKAKMELSMLTLGDWGAPFYTGRKAPAIQTNVAALLAKSAENLHPVAILGHGDNFYWAGVGPDDYKRRMRQSFENVYNHPSLKHVPFLSVAGNHDLGGGAYICGRRDGRYRACRSPEEFVYSLNRKFDLQSKFQSRSTHWVMRDHYYKESFGVNNVSVDVFNIDTNYADVHGAHSICCQCYGYRNGNESVDCGNVEVGSPYCAGGRMDMYNACTDTITKWANTSIDRIRVDLAKSKATYKVINTHHSPFYHMSEDKMAVWANITRDYGVHLWINGHTHSLNHDISRWKTHFLMNGAGGGMNPESGYTRWDNSAQYIDTNWNMGGTFGFFELSFSEDWMKVESATFDKNWNLTTSPITIGGVKHDYCYYIPRVGRPGRSCPPKPTMVAHRF